MTNRELENSLKQKFLGICDDILNGYEIIYNLYNNEKYWLINNYAIFKYSSKNCKITYHTDEKEVICSWIGRGKKYHTLSMKKEIVDKWKNDLTSLTETDLDIFISEYPQMKKNIIKDVKAIKKTKENHKKKFFDIVKSCDNFDENFDITKEISRRKLMEKIQENFESINENLVNMNNDRFSIEDNQMLHKFTGQVVYPVGKIEDKMFDISNINKYIALIIDSQTGEKFLKKSGQEYLKNIQKVLKY